MSVRVLPGALTKADWPTIERALELVDLIQRGERIDVHEADRCYFVFGYPELEPGAVVLALAEVSMRPRPQNITDTTVERRAITPATNTVEPTYGFTNRK
jgi:hypothetical protein